MRSKHRAGSVSPTHAGGAVYWEKEDAVLCLLVRPKNGADEWVLPKGHIETGEDDTQAALREVREETGVIARLICPLLSVQFKTSREPVKARFFLMERVSKGESGESREIRWLPYDEALKSLTHPESRKVLRAAEKRRAMLSAQIETS